MTIVEKLKLVVGILCAIWFAIAFRLGAAENEEFETEEIYEKGKEE